jgi:hypothetical protein
MDESDDFCPTRPKGAKLIHAACVTVLRVDQVASMVHLITSAALTSVDPRRGIGSGRPSAANRITHCAWWISS